MVEFAGSLTLPKARRVAYSEVLIQISEEQGLAAAIETGDEIAMADERALLLLNVVEKHLLPPFQR